MTLTELNDLTINELKKLKRLNNISFHSFLWAAVLLTMRAFSEIDALILLTAMGLTLVSRTFYLNCRLLESLRQEKLKA